jgi:hypothetical protein
MQELAYQDRHIAVLAVAFHQPNGGLRFGLSHSDSGRIFWNKMEAQTEWRAKQF